MVASSEITISVVKVQVTQKQDAQKWLLDGGGEREGV
jgi:hypothetical protein